MSALLRIRSLTKRFVADGAPVVDDVGFEVQRGEILVLLGPSGCGKTTTLRLIAGFEHADHGYIVLENRMLTVTPGCGGAPGVKPVHMRPENRGIGFVFQDYALFPHLSVLKNTMYGLRGSWFTRKARALEALQMVGMADYASRKPHTLSGGQQQRVALARSMAPAPKLILLDEPFSNLDAGLRETTRQEVRKLLHEQNMAAILVTHDQEEALSFGDRIAVMNQGKIEQIGSPVEVYEKPATMFVASFLGKTNLLRVDASEGVAESPVGILRLNRPKTGTVTVSLRPEHLTLTEHLNGPGTPCTGQIVSRDFRGHDLIFRVKVGAEMYTVHTDYRCRFEPGDQVRVSTTEQAVVVG